MVDAYFGRFVLPEDLHAALLKCRSIAYIETQEELDELVFGPTHSSRYDVVYNIVGLMSPPQSQCGTPRKSRINSGGYCLPQRWQRLRYTEPWSS